MVSVDGKFALYSPFFTTFSIYLLSTCVLPLLSPETLGFRTTLHWWKGRHRILSLVVSSRTLTGTKGLSLF
jgi:hypothetical protein